MSARIRIAVRKFDPFEKAIARQFADFTRGTGMVARLDIEALDLNPLHDSLFVQRGLANGTFDLAFISTDWLAQAQSAGLIRDLQLHLARARIPDFPDAWSPSLLNLQRFHGGFWGMPYHDGPQCLIYRKDLLEAASIAVPTTWAEFHEAARRLHAPERGRYGTVLALYPDGHNNFYYFCIHIWTRGGEPFAPEPIVIIGSGGIVTDAHLPAYRKAGLPPVAGVFDLDGAKARVVAQQWKIPRVFDSLREAAAVTGYVFDVAAPPVVHAEIIGQLPRRAAVLIQKPMGLDLQEATRIRDLCRERGLIAQTRTSAILDYGTDLRVTLSINHHHDFGRRFQDASFRFEGDGGAAMVKLGLLLNYPAGDPDELWVAPKGGPWEQVALGGSWFPDAFIGTMSNLQRFAAGED